MHCEECGKQIPDDSKFCEFCGHPISLKTESREPIKPEKKIQTEHPKKKKSRPFFMPIIVIAILGLATYFAFTFLNVGDIIRNLSDTLFSKNGSSEISRNDFDWYNPSSFDEVPQGATSLDFDEIQGDWKLMVINYVSDPEETYFSTVVLSPSESSTDNISIDFTHHFVEYDGERYDYTEEESKDLLYANFSDGILTLQLDDERRAEIIFWRIDGKDFGQSHIYQDWDSDGIEDLVNVLLFTR